MRNKVVPHKFIDQSKSSSMDVAPMDVFPMEVHELGFETMDLNIAKLRLDQSSGSIMDNINSECIDSLNFYTQEDSDKNRSNVCDD